MIGYNPDGSAFYSDIIGDFAEIPNVHPVTDLPTTPDYTVSNLSGLQSAISSASAGQSIELQDGSYGTWNVTKNNSGSKIRVFCRNWHGAVFSEIRLDGAHHLSIENVRVTSSLIMNSSTEAVSGDMDFKGMLARNVYVRGIDGALSFDHCIFDGNFSSGVTPGRFNYLDAPVTNTNCIYCRAGDDLVAGYLNNTTSNRFTMQECALVNARVADVGSPHPDLFQIFSPTSCITFDRVVLWVEATQSGNKGYQGLFTSDGSLTSSVIRNVYVNATLARKISVNAMAGEIRDSICSNGRIYGEDKNGTGDNSQLDVVNNIASGIISEGTAGAFKSEVGNLEYGEGNQDTVLTNATGDFSSWRDFITLDNVNNRQGQAYLETLDALWSGIPQIPSDGLVTFNSTIAG
ncbi:MAG: hypothetical protein ACPG4X_15750 [Pikeienuella sp.]